MIFSPPRPAAAVVPLLRARAPTLAVGAALFAFALLLRLPFLSVPMISDEGAYAYVARFWSSDYLLYRDIPFDRPEGIFLIYRAILAFVGKSVTAIRLAAALYNGVTTLVLWRLAHRLLGARQGAVAALLFALLSTSPQIEGFTANAELFVLLPLTLAARLTWEGRWRGAAFLSAIAILIKPVGIAGLVLLFGWMLLRRAGRRSMLLAALVAGLPVAASLLHGLAVGWDAYWYSFVGQRLLAYSALSFGPLQQGALFLLNGMMTSPAWLAAAVLTLLGLSTLEQTRRRFLLLYLVASLLGMGLGGNWYWHYFQQLIPPLALGAAAGAATFMTLTGAPRLRWFGLVAVGVLLFVAHEVPFWFQTPEQVSERLYQRPGYLVADEVAAHLRATTPPEAQIYVAFSEAETYYLADRRAALPEQLFHNQLVFLPGMYERVTTAIRAGEPARVIWFQPPPAHLDDAASFRAVLDERYEVERRFGEVLLFRPREP